MALREDGAACSFNKAHGCFIKTRLNLPGTCRRMRKAWALHAVPQRNTENLERGTPCFLVVDRGIIHACGECMHGLRMSLSRRRCPNWHFYVALDVGGYQVLGSFSGMHLIVLVPRAKLLCDRACFIAGINNKSYC